MPPCFSRTTSDFHEPLARMRLRAIRANTHYQGLLIRGFLNAASLFAQSDSRPRWGQREQSVSWEADDIGDDEIRAKLPCLLRRLRHPLDAAAGLRARGRGRATRRCLRGRRPSRAAPAGDPRPARFCYAAARNEEPGPMSTSTSSSFTHVRFFARSLNRSACARRAESWAAARS
jgi:hypothetical protein